MLTLVLDPGGEPRIVKLELALYLLGFDVRRCDRTVEATPEERRQRRLARKREYRRRAREPAREAAP